ncbi:c-type cytochrome [Cyclobacterium marinum]|nr:c-type cytochrome [Cyclobacterium marinum]
MIKVWIVFFTITGCNTQEKNEPSPALSPQEALKKFEFNEDLTVQLVAAEPLIEDPVFTSFDEVGRLWVVEMRGFMNTIDGHNEQAPNGRISILEDINGDGEMDKKTIYLDSLILPRALAIVSNGALVAENMALWWTQDLDGDLVADTKVLVDPDYAGSNLPEHAGNGLLRGIDNWYYNAKSRFRYKLKDQRWIKDSTEFRGQWGISQDNYGRLYYNYNWSPLHADLVPPNYFNRNLNHSSTSGIDQGLTSDREIFPVRENLAINRGYIPGTLDKRNRLKEFTSACSPFYYRGDGLPSQYSENVFICEPSGNLIKRNGIKDNEIFIQTSSPDQGRSVIASRDERFRPVSLTSGPDGALYITDMYRGLIQHAAYISSYLKAITINRKLELPTHYGRIWRLTEKNQGNRSVQKLSELKHHELVHKLKHPNGWHRDMAQRLLVEKKDKNTVKILEELALDNKYPLAQIHALWTLEGMGRLDAKVIISLLEIDNSKNPQVTIHALRLAEQFSSENSVYKEVLENSLFKIVRSKNSAISLQLVLSSGNFSPKFNFKVLLVVLEPMIDEPIFRDAALSSLYDHEFSFLQLLLEQKTWQNEGSSRAIFIEMLATAICNKYEPSEMRKLVKILDNSPPSQDWKSLAIFRGMTVASSHHKSPLIRLPKAPLFTTTTEFEKSDLNINQLNQLFDWPGKNNKVDSLKASFNLSNSEKISFAKGRQLYVSTCAGCHGEDGEGVNRMGPPLNNSEWVTGSEKRLAMILIHGLEGPLTVNGVQYQSPEILPIMPSMASLDNGRIANILTYIRNEWNNNAPAVKSGTVAELRLSTQGRVLPWKPEDLLKYEPPVNPLNKP